MNKKLVTIISAVIFVLSGTALVFAQEGPDGNKRKGKYTYRNVYKACSERGEVQSTTPIVNPSDKTMAQWKRIFDKKKFEIFKCSDEFNRLSDTDLLDIYTYLYSSAADSPTPAKCK